LESRQWGLAALGLLIGTWLLSSGPVAAPPARAEAEQPANTR